MHIAMNKLRNATLIFLVRKTDGEIKNICLDEARMVFGR
jgi:hypothetical protein